MLRHWAANRMLRVVLARSVGKEDDHPYAQKES
jgi:hypothetical protein